MTCILLLSHENRFTTGFKQKNELFNIFYGKHCSLTKTAQKSLHTFNRQFSIK